MRFGEHHVLDSIILAGKEKKAYRVDAAKSRKEAWWIRLGVVAAGESGGKEAMEYLIGRPWAEEWLHSATAEMLD